MARTRAVLPVQTGVQPVSERMQAGKALRKICPRSSFGSWEPATDRADPIDLLIANSQGRLENLVAIRYGRMMASPFAFYRGSAAIMAHDLAKAEMATGLRFVICGDAHLMNFGGFRTPERRLIFDLNDFDEAAVGPWEWDVQRLAASFHIAADSIGARAGEREEAAWWAARSYRQHLARYTEMPLLEAHYEYIDLNELVEAGSNPELRRFHTRRIARATEDTVHSTEFAKFAYVSGERPRIRDDPPLIFHLNDIVEDEKFRAQAASMLKHYLNHLSGEKRVLLSRYTLTDAAMKVVGIGSVGTRCGIALFISGSGDPLFLQFKEAGPSVIEAYMGEAPFKTAGERVVYCQRLMQAASDFFLGATIGEEGRHYYVRQLRDAKVSPVIEMMEAEDLVGYAKACGWALARAHQRSGDAAVLTGYLGKGEAFEDAMAKFATAYAQQNEADHAALLAAIKSGRIDARTDLT